MRVFRWKAIVPLGLLFVLVGAGWYFLLDSAVRSGIEAEGIVSFVLQETLKGGADLQLLLWQENAPASARHPLGSDRIRLGEG